MPRHLHALCAALLLCCSTPSMAWADAPAHRLEELRREALLHNPGLKSWRRAHRASKAAIGSSRQLPDPSLSVTEFLEEPQTRVGAQRRKLSWSQPFPAWGSLDARESLAQTKAEHQELRFQANRDHLFLHLHLGLIKIVLLNRQVEIHRQHLDILGKRRSSAEAGVEAGRQGIADVLQTQLEMEGLEDRLLSLTQRRPVLHQHMESLVGQPLEDRWPNAFPRAPKLASMEVLEQAYRQTNPMWRAAAIEVREAQIQEQITRLKSRPSTALGLSWTDTESRPLPMEGNGDDPLAVHLSLKLPIWGDSLDAQGERDRQLRLGAQSKREQRWLAFEAKLQQLLFQWEDLKRRETRLQERSLPLAHKAHEALLLAHENNRSPFGEILRSEQRLLELSLQLLGAQAEKSRTSAELQHLIPSLIVEEDQP